MVDQSFSMKIIIKPKKGLASLDFKELWRYRELFYFFAWRDIKIRYKQTILGITWAILQPFVMMIVFSFVFGKMANVPSDNIPYPIFSYTGLLFWNIFSSSLGRTSGSLVVNINIVKKVYLPKIILPASSVVVSLIDFCFASLIFGIILAYYKFLPNFKGLLFLPIALLITVIASLGLGLFLCALNVRYRDVRYALPFFMGIFIFITPVIYPVSIVPKAYQWLLALNPMTGVIETFKAGFLSTTSINWMTLGISTGMAVLFLILGLWYFLRTEKTFADVI